jgi:hypothetical protein
MGSFGDDATVTYVSGACPICHMWKEHEKGCDHEKVSIAEAIRLEKEKKLHQQGETETARDPGSTT